MSTTFTHKQCPKLIALFVFYIISCRMLLAAPAYPYPVTFTQPDGDTLTIVMKGDESLKYAETEDGYTLMYDEKGALCYAQRKVNGDIEPSKYIARSKRNRTSDEANFLRTISLRLSHSKSQLSSSSSIPKLRSSGVDLTQKAFPATGERKLLCILIGTPDRGFVKTQNEFNNLFNQVGYSVDGADGSVRDYFLEASYGQLNLSTDVVGPFTASKDMAYYTYNYARTQELILEACAMAHNSGVDFSVYDNDKDGVIDGLYIIYAGHGQESGASNSIWAHAGWLPETQFNGVWVQNYACSPERRYNSGTYMTHIGIICHEFGHTLGAGDYYGGIFAETGPWDLMAGGSWNNDGRTPPHPNPYVKIYNYNWATVTELNTPQVVTVSPSIDDKTAFYKVNTTTPGEYFLIENRQQKKFDTHIPGRGLMIYRSSVEAPGATNLQKFYPVSANAPVPIPRQGDALSNYGNISIASCPWPGTGNKTLFTDATTPWMKSWANANTGKPITNIVENITTGDITFSFMGVTDYYIIQASANQGGVLSPSGNVIVTHGNSQAFIITPDPGKKIASVVVDGEIVPEAVVAGSYTFTNVAGNHKIDVTFIDEAGLGIAIDKVNFPDDYFRIWALTRPWGSDAILTPDEIAGITNMSVNNMGISDLKGLEYFTALKELYCYNNKLFSLDVSNLTNLETLFCDNNQLTSLDVSNLTNLKHLSCSNNKLTSLDVSGKKTNLVTLHCSNNQLATLNVSNLINLESFACHGNHLTAIDVWGLTKLIGYIPFSLQTPILTLTLTADGTYSAAIALHNPTLSKFAAGITYKDGKLISNSNAISQSDFEVDVVGRNAKLTGTITLLYNEACAHDFSLFGTLVSAATCESPAKHKAKCSICGAESESDLLDGISINCGIAINAINFPDANFRAWALSQPWGNDAYLSAAEIASITEINVRGKGIASLKGIEYFTALKTLDCSNNQLETLDISALTNLQYFSCQNNQLTSLDLSGSPFIKGVECFNQTPTLTLNADGGVYSVAITLNNLTKLANGITYAGGKLISNSNTIASTPFEVNVTGNAAKLSGTITLLYGAVEVCTHDFSILGTLVSAATCTTSAKHKAKCSLCGEEHATLLLNGASALGHDFSVWIVNPANATEQIEVCSRCGEPSGNSREIVCEHTFTAWEITTPATCTATGVRTEKCSLCGTLGTTTQVIPALGHNYTTVVILPTCTAQGYTTYTCTRGDDEYVGNYVAALGHNFSVWIINPANANEEIEVCSRCGEPSGNSREIAVVINCNGNGIAINATNFPDANFRAWALSQPWGSDACLSVAEIAGITEINVSGKGIASLKGIEHFTFLKTLNCSNNQLTVLNLSGLSHIQYLSCQNNQLTALDVSSSQFIKGVESFNQTPTLTLAADGSVYSVAIALSNPTRLASGISYAGGKLISNSNTIATTPFEVNVTGNSAKLSGTITLLYGGTVEVCEHEFTVLGTLVSAATCTTPAKHKAKCSLCGAEHVTLLLNGAPALGHGFTAWEITTLATCTTTGVRTEKCSRCGVLGTQTQVIAALGHNFTVWIVTSNANEEIEVCSRCGEPSGNSREIPTTNCVGGIAVNATNFPDANFRTWILSQPWGSDACISTNAIAGIRDINVSGKNIADLTGINYFTGLQYLNCSNNQLTTLNVTGLTHLIGLDCRNNQLTLLDVSGLVHLKYLDCDNNGLVTLRVAKLANFVTYNGDAETHIIEIDENAISINVYPNPTADKVYLSTDANVQLFTQQGALLYVGYGNKIDLTNYPQGIYILKINGDMVVKVVKL
ncbi:MAG: M6 family metalloprotease domain-containing protein [Bacteroidetes bacterium]|nr:M6 family metalloprotease domain-containing protein [Bacteroidota bacterium]